MSDTPNTLFLRLEGPLQAWGDTSKFVMRRTMEAPTKSGVLGLICCAMGVRRKEARDVLKDLNTLVMGVRIDRPGMRWWDYHTVGAKIGIPRADGKGIKHIPSTDVPETLISRREYLCDASFLVAVQGEADLIAEVHGALLKPEWPVFLGRKSCPPSTPILARVPEGETWTNPATYGDLLAALAEVPWHPRLKEIDGVPEGELPCLIEWQPHHGGSAPPDADVWYDAPVSFDPPVHEPRLVLRLPIPVEFGEEIQKRTPPPPRPWAKYGNTDYQKRRAERLGQDEGVCVFCKCRGTTVHHVSYRHAGGDESLEDLRSLCRLCHHAVTMIEYGLGMGLDRIDPVDVRWRDHIIKKRDEIRKWRSEEKRRRALRGAPEKVRRELLEDED